MWCNRYLFLFFIYYSTIQYGILANKFRDFENRARAMGLQSSGSTGSTGIIYINGHECKIFDLNANYNTVKGYDKDTLKIFHICMNCMFATWTQGELFKLIQFFPILYSWKFGSKHTNIFIEKYDDIETRFNLITNQINDFITILLNFFDINTYSTYLDTSVLKALLSLNFKIEYKKLYYNPVDNDKNTVNQHHLDKYIVRLVMEVVNDLQIFMTANCQLSEKYDDNIFFPYLIPYPNSIDIHQFLIDIKPLQLELPNKNQCNTEKLLLENILLSTDHNNILLGMLDMRLDIGCNKEIEFFEIINIFKKNHDLQLIHWYQETIMNTILVLLITKIKLYFTSFDYNKPNLINFMNQFKIINSEFLSAFAILPQNIIDFFDLLASNKNYDKIDLKEFTSIPDSMNDFNLRPIGKIPVDMNITEHLKLLLNSTLEEFSSFLVTNIEMFSCFLQSFKFLNKEFNTYYTPFKKDYNKIVNAIIKDKRCTWESNKEVNKIKKILNANSYDSYFTANIIYTHDFDAQKGCNFFTALSNYSIDALRFINQTCSGDVYEDYTHTYNNLNKIKTSLEKAHQFDFNHRLQTTTYNILPYIDINFNNYVNVSCLSYHKRIMYLMAIELNYYGLDYCHPPEYNFLTFNNIHEFGDSNHYNYHVRKYLRRLRFADELNGSDFKPPVNHKLIKLTNIYDEYSKHQHTYKEFDNIIKLKWKGEEYKNIGEIHNDIITNVAQTFYNYAFIDIFLKFSFAAIIYVLNEYQSKTEIRLNRVECNEFLHMYRNELIIKNLRVIRHFFAKLISNISKQMDNIHRYYCMDENDKKNEFIQIHQNIVDEFEKLGVLINFNYVIEESSTSETHIIEESKVDQTVSANDITEGATQTYNVVRIQIISFILRTVQVIDKNLNEHSMYVYS